MKKTILKNTSIVSLGNNLSRVLGLVRDVVIAKFFGTGFEAAAFVVAFTLPNMLRDFVGEGASNAAVVPVITEYKAKSTPKEFWKKVGNLLNVFIVILLIVSALGVIFAPALVRLIAPGFAKEAGGIETTVRLTRVIFPYILFMGLTAFSMGILNILGYFALPSFCQSILNITLIASAIVLCPRFGVMGLAVGVLIGGILEIASLLPSLSKNGLRPNRAVDFRDPAVKKVGALMAPRVVGTAVYQINVLVDRMLGSLFWIVGQGAIPALYYSYRLVQYPIGIFSTALGTAVLPVMSKQFVDGDTKELKKTLEFSMKGIFLVMIPASVGLMAMGRPIIKIIFERGAFNDYSTSITYLALVFYSFGLFAYGGIKILAMCFYAMKDTVTPVRTASAALIVNIALNLILMWPLKVGGLALATSIAAICNFSMLFRMLQRRLGAFNKKEILRFLGKIITASLVMGGVCFYMSNGLISSCWNTCLLNRIFYLLGITLSGMLVFFMMSIILKIDEMRKFLKWILKRA